MTRLVSTWLGRLRAFAAHAEVREFSANTIWALAAYGVMVGVEKLVVMPYLGRHLDEAAFGLLLLARNTATVLASGLFAGLHNLLLRRNQEWPGPAKAVAVRSAAVLGGGLALVELLVVLAVLAWRGGLAARAALLAAFAVWGLANVVNNLWQT